MGSKATFFAYEKCSTCRNARKALEAMKVPFEQRPIVDEPPTVEELRDLWKRSGLPLQKFFNTSGESYRALRKTTDPAALGDEEKLRLLAKDGKLVKRPILDDGKRVFVGFDPATYESAFGGRS